MKTEIIAEIDRRIGAILEFASGPGMPRDFDTRYQVENEQAARLDELRELREFIQGMNPKCLRCDAPASDQSNYCENCRPIKNKEALRKEFLRGISMRVFQKAKP